MKRLKFRSKSEAKGEPVEFEFLDEVFKCRGSLPATVMFRVAVLTKQSKNDDTISIDVMMSFFRGVLISESWARFSELIEDPDNEVDMEDLSEILEALMEEYMERPTRGDSGMSSQSLSTGDVSMRGASSQVSTYSRSQPTESAI